MALWNKLKKFFGIEQEPTNFPRRDEIGRWVDDSPKVKPATVKVEFVPATTGTKPTDIPTEVLRPSQSSAGKTKPKPKPTAKAAPATATVKKPLKEASRDGDGDGYINDGKPNQRKVEPKKKPSATTKKKPKPKA